MVVWYYLQDKKHNVSIVSGLRFSRSSSPHHAKVCIYLKMNDLKDENFHAKIIMEISQTNFKNLSTIQLSKLMIKTERNKIVSIEQLQFMNMPVLSHLWLGK